MSTEANTSNVTNDFVMIDMKGAVDPHLPEKSKKIITVKKLCGQMYTPSGHRTVPYYQDQNVGSQPVYYRSPQPVSNRRNPEFQQSQGSEDNFGRDIIFLESFSEQDIRSKFIKKVYAILSVQLLFTFAFVCICTFDENVRNYVREDIPGVLVACFLQIIIYFVLICYADLRRMFPLNFIFLALLTLAFTYLTGALSTMYTTKVVMLSIGITAALCSTISIAACQTSFDVTRCLPFLCFVIAISFIMIITLMIVRLFVYIRAVDIIIGAVIGLVFCLYLIFDTQMIMGGRRIELSPEEYILGALTLYVDIIQILWAIMRIVGECTK